MVHFTSWAEVASRCAQARGSTHAVPSALARLSLRTVVEDHCDCGICADTFSRTSPVVWTFSHSDRIMAFVAPGEIPIHANQLCATLIEWLQHNKDCVTITGAIADARHPNDHTVCDKLGKTASLLVEAKRALEDRNNQLQQALDNANSKVGSDFPNHGSTVENRFFESLDIQTAKIKLSNAWTNYRVALDDHELIIDDFIDISQVSLQEPELNSDDESYTNESTIEDTATDQCDSGVNTLPTNEELRKSPTPISAPEPVVEQNAPSPYSLTEEEASDTPPTTPVSTPARSSDDDIPPTTPVGPSPTSQSSSKTDDNKTKNGKNKKEWSKTPHTKPEHKPKGRTLILVPSKWSSDRSSCSSNDGTGDWSAS